MPPKKFKKYARSTSPSRLQQNDDPSPSKEQSDFNFLIGALTSRILEKGLMDNKFLKNFFLNRDDQKKNKSEQVNIVEKKLIQCLRFPKKIQNQATIRLIEEFAKEKGFTIENSIKYQQYEILKKPIIFQPTMFVTKEENWYDIFEQFKSENLKIVPDQNLQDFNNLINNQQLSTWEKLQHILKQRFMIHNASEFPDDNPVTGNEDQDGNLQFVIDENQIPHRVIFKNKDEYELLNWYVDHQNKNELNIIKQDWSIYVKNVQKLRDKKPQSQEKERKIIQLNTQMQVELEKSNQVDTISQQKQKNQISSTEKQNIQIQFKQSQQNSLKPQQEQIIKQNSQAKNNQSTIQQSSSVQKQQLQQDQLKQQMLQSQIENKVIELKQQNQQIANQLFEQDLEKINKLTIDELADQVLSDFGIIPNLSNITTQLQNDEKLLITVQFPIEVKNKQQIKILQNNFEQEFEKGFIYLNEAELIQLDQEIKNSLYNIGFKERKILSRGQEYTMTSPFCIQTTLMPLNMARQWMYFKDKQSVKVYIIQAQTFWIFQQLLSDNMSKNQAQSYVQFTYQNYVDKWINFMNTNASLWKKTSEDVLQAKAQNISADLIAKSDDQDSSHYSLKIIEDVWFTFSCIKQFILINTIYDVKQTILFYLNIKGEFFETSLSIKDLLTGMWGYGIGIQMSPIFEPTFTHDVVCWLCYTLHNSWENFYIHKCANSQANAKSSFKQDHLLVWKQFKSK